MPKAKPGITESRDTMKNGQPDSLINWIRARYWEKKYKGTYHFGNNCCQEDDQEDVPRAYRLLLPRKCGEPMAQNGCPRLAAKTEQNRGADGHQTHSADLNQN
jgi:hypothetical protein